MTVPIKLPPALPDLLARAPARPEPGGQDDFARMLEPSAPEPARQPTGNDAATTSGSDTGPTAAPGEPVDPAAEPEDETELQVGLVAAILTEIEALARQLAPAADGAATAGETAPGLPRERIEALIGLLGRLASPEGGAPGIDGEPLPKALSEALAALGDWLETASPDELAALDLNPPAARAFAGKLEAALGRLGLLAKTPVAADPLLSEKLGSPAEALQGEPETAEMRTAPTEARPAAPAATARPVPIVRPVAPAEVQAPPPPDTASSPDVALQPLPATTTAPAGEASAVRALPPAYPATLQQLDLPRIAFALVRQFESGNSRFQIRLDPPEMGRIDVHLDLDERGGMKARLAVERPETLDLMLRDQRVLERALAQAGLDTARTSLEFTLKDENARSWTADADGREGEPSEDAEIAPAGIVQIYRAAPGPGGINIVA